MPINICYLLYLVDRRVRSHAGLDDSIAIRARTGCGAPHRIAAAGGNGTFTRPFYLALLT
jgi:hypothetical protein